MGITRLSLEDICCVLILLFFGMAGSIPGIAPNQASEMTGAPPSGLMFIAGVGSQLLVDAVMLVLAVRVVWRLFACAGTLQFAGLLAVFSVCSALWSQDPVLSARRALPFALAAVFGLYLATRHSLRRQLVLFEAAFLLLAVASALLALGMPKLGLDASAGHLGDWQGVFTQKNACGRAMVFATAVVLAQGALNWRRAASLATFLLVLGMSGSRGAWVIEAMLFGIALCMGLLARFKRIDRVLLAIFAFMGAATAGVLGKIYFPLLASLIGRDPTLTGRTAIWAQVWVAILKRPWLGYGFAAFWRGTKGASFEVVVALKFVLFHAHNGFLEIWLELGAIGLVLFALSYMRAWQQLWPRLAAERRSGGMEASAWPVYILVLIAAYDLDENTLLSFNGLFWVLYVHALVTAELSAACWREARQQVAPAPIFGFIGGLRTGLWAEPPPVQPTVAAPAWGGDIAEGWPWR